MPEIDATNKFLVSSLSNDRIVLLNPPRGPMSQEDALVLAAWLVTLSMSSPEDFQRAFDAVRST